MTDEQPTVRLLAGRLHRASPGSAGYDLEAAGDVTIPPGGQACVRTGVRTDFPPSLVALVRDRSGLARDRRLTVRAGVIDADYRGEWLVLLANEGPAPAVVAAGTRVAQAIFLSVPGVSVVPTGDADVTLCDSGRAGGFGSTGCGPPPLPQRGPAGPPVWDMVVADMWARDALGRRRYGRPLTPHNGRDVLRDAYEETLDLAAYLRQAIAERDDPGVPCAS